MNRRAAPAGTKERRLEGAANVSATLDEALAMVKDYYGMASKTKTTIGYEGVVFNQEEAGPTI